MTAGYSGIKEDLEAKGGIGRVEMRRLRDAAGWDRLGPDVNQSINRQMKAAGLATLPANDLLSKRRQDESVRVYVVDSRVGQVIKAVTDPSLAGDRLLNNIGRNKSGEIVQQIRAVLSGA